MKIQSAMRTMTVLAMVCNVAAWTVERTGRRAAFLSSTHNFENHDFENYHNNSTGTDWKNMVGASYQKMADTFETAEETAAIEVESRVVTAIEKNKQVKKSSALDVDGISMQRGSANRPGAEKKNSSPSNESSCDRSEKAGDDEEEEYIEENEDWNDYKEQRGGIVKATPRDGNKLELDSTLQQNRGASPREGIKLEQILNFGGGFQDEEEPRQQSNGDDDLLRRILCSAIIVVANFIEMIMRMRNEGKNEFVYYCKIETNNLCFMCLEFIVSPFLLLRTSKKPYHDNQHHYQQMKSTTINIHQHNMQQRRTNKR